MSVNSQLLKTLATIPWLIDLSQDQLLKLEKISGFRYLNEEEQLYREGNKEKLLYIIAEGSIRIEIQVPSHGKMVLIDAEPLDLIGWESLIPVAMGRITSAYALSNCNLVYFDGKALEELYEKDSQIGYLFMNRLANVIASRMIAMRLKFFSLIIDKE